MVLEYSVYPEAPYQSHSPVLIARTLLKDYCQALIERNGAKGQEVADNLLPLMDVLWQDEALKEKPVSKEEIEAKISAVLATLTTQDQQYNFLEAYAKAGQLYEIASLAARDNFFETQRRTNGKASGSSTEFIDSCENVQQAVETLNKPVKEVVMTAHPTNVNSYEVIEATKEVGEALDNLRGYNTEASNGRKIINPEQYKGQMHQAMQKFAAAPLSPEQDGSEHTTRNLSVTEETQQMLYYLTNTYKALPRVYKKFDKPLFHRAREDETTYNPADLKLRMRYASWGSSGDKDGNDKVTCDTTLEAFSLHRKKILELYLADLKEISPLTPNALLLQEEISKAQEKVNAIAKEVSEKIKDNQALTSEEFDGFSKNLAEAMSGLADEKWEDQLYIDYKQATKTHNPAAPQILDLARKLYTFGFHLAHIEYRETAEEYTAALDAIFQSPAVVAKFGELPESNRVEERARFLSELVESGNAAHAFALYRDNYAAEHDGRTLEKDALGKSYKTKDSEGNVTRYTPAIVYNTMKRLELARDHPDMVHNNVLAECENQAHIMEALFLQASTQNKEGKRTRLGLVPLFEDAKYLQDAGKTVVSLLELPAYQDHLEALQTLRGEDPQEVTQQLQIAHSDNSRRNGTIAARAFIYEAHDAVRAAVKEKRVNGKPVRLQFFEGSGQSDAYRGGVRAHTASSNLYGLHEFYKTTFQGGDMLHYFNFPAAITRLFVRNLTHSAAVLLGKRSPTTLNDLIYGKNSLLGALYDPSDENIEVSQHVESTLCDIFKSTNEYYQKQFFETQDPESIEGFNAFYGKLGLGQLDTAARNYGSRAAMRGGKSITNITKERTIGFSETLQHNMLSPEWLGAGAIKDELDKTIKSLCETIRKSSESENYSPFERLLAFSVQDNIAPNTYKSLYRNSPIFRDVMDRLASSVVRTDFTACEKLNTEACKVEMTDIKIHEKRLVVDVLKEEYETAAQYAYAAITGKKLHTRDAKGNIATDHIREHMLKALPHLAPVIEDKRRYASVMLEAKKQWGKGLMEEFARVSEEAAREVGSTIQCVALTIARLLESIGDCLMGNVRASDPMYAREVNKARQASIQNRVM